MFERKQQAGSKGSSSGFGERSCKVGLVGLLQAECVWTTWSSALLRVPSSVLGVMGPVGIRHGLHTPSGLVMTHRGIKRSSRQ